MQGLQRATEAARASRGLSPRPVHIRSLSGGNNTICGRGGVTFSAPIADTADEATCKNCLKVYGAIERDRAAREGPMTAISRDRHDTIRRAIALIDTTSPADLWRYLAQTDIHAHLKADPAALRRTLADADGTAQVFGAWKAAQQLLKAAGLPY